MNTARQSTAVSCYAACLYCIVVRLLSRPDVRCLFYTQTQLQLTVPLMRLSNYFHITYLETTGGGK
jgi:hypothetical protein